MFGSKKENNSESRIAVGIKKSISSDTRTSGGTHTIIGSTVRIEGNINCKGDLRIDGQIKGNIKATGRLVQGHQSIIEGDVDCVNAELEGTVIGRVNCSELLTVKSSAKIEGEVVMKKLSVEPGAIFNVTCKVQGQGAEKGSEGSTLASTKVKTTKGL